MLDWLGTCLRLPFPSIPLLTPLRHAHLNNARQPVQHYTPRGCPIHPPASPPLGRAEASSSRPSNGKQPAVHDHLSDDDEDALLADDPLDHILSEEYVSEKLLKWQTLTSSLPRVSFQRKQKATPASLGLSRFLPSPLGNSSSRASPVPRTPGSRLQQLRSNPNANRSTELILNYLDSPGNAGDHLQDTKDATGLDWYVEGPGRRVGYDDLTAIDWIFEYAKERQRLRHLQTSSTGILGHIKQLADASQVWIILVAAGILSGGIAAFIDVASDWLADLKTGYCSNVDGDGQIYLNKAFCCWGIGATGECHDWSSWGAAMGIGSAGGRWMVEYIFFILFSVCDFLLLQKTRAHIFR